MPLEIASEKKVLLVLKALLEGQRIKYKGETYLLCDKYEICMLAHDHNQEEHYLIMNMSLSEFINWSFKIDSDHLFILGCERVISNINNKRNI